MWRVLLKIAHILWPYWSSLLGAEMYRKKLGRQKERDHVYYCQLESCVKVWEELPVVGQKSIRTLRFKLHSTFFVNACCSLWTKLWLWIWATDALKSCHSKRMFWVQPPLSTHNIHTCTQLHQAGLLRNDETEIVTSYRETSHLPHHGSHRQTSVELNTGYLTESLLTWWLLSPVQILCVCAWVCARWLRVCHVQRPCVFCAATWPDVIQWTEWTCRPFQAP